MQPTPKDLVYLYCLDITLIGNCISWGRTYYWGAIYPAHLEHLMS